MFNDPLKGKKALNRHLFRQTPFSVINVKGTQRATIIRYCFLKTHSFVKNNSWKRTSNDKVKIFFKSTLKGLSLFRSQRYLLYFNLDKRKYSLSKFYIFCPVFHNASDTERYFFNSILGEKSQRDLTY